MKYIMFTHRLHELFVKRDIYSERVNMFSRENNSILSTMVFLLFCCAMDDGYICNQVEGTSKKLMR